MKIAKMICTTTLLSLAAIAFFGVSSTMAETTALCSRSPENLDIIGGEPLEFIYLSGEVCPTGHLLTHTHELTVASRKMELKSSLPTIECNALFLGNVPEIENEKGEKLTLALSSPLVITGSFTYSSCKNFCTVKEESASAELIFLRTSHETATVTEKFLLHVNCPFISCDYVGEGIEGTAKGHHLTSEAGYENGKVIISEQKVEKEFGSCPWELFLSIYTTPLSQTFITS